MKDELWINGRQMELSEMEPVGFTYLNNDIAQLLEPGAAYSNRFLIPGTNTNNINLNNSYSVSTNTLAPYRRLPCTYIRNGVPIVNNGVAIIENAKGDFEITVYSGIFDFFQQLGDKTLKDIPWSEYNHTFDVATIKQINIDYCAGNSDISWPLIQWGAHVVDSPIDVKYQQAAISLSVIMDKIFGLTTYKKEGAILGDGIYLDTQLTLSPDEYEVTDEELEARSYKATIDSNISDIGVPAQGGPAIANLIAFFDDVTAPGKDSTECIYRDTNTSHRKIISWPQAYLPLQILNKSSYQSRSYTTIQIDVKLLFHHITIGSIDSYRIFKNNVLINNVSFGGGGGPTLNFNFENSYTVDLKPGDEIKIQIYATNFLINQKNLASNYLSITALNTIPFNATLDYNYLMPEYKLKDIISSFCQMFGLIISPPKSSNTINFTKFLEPKQNILQADDWTDKLDLSEKPSISYRIGYAQLNRMKYAPNDYTVGFGDSSFQINDTVLPPEATQAELIYPSALPIENIQTISGNKNQGVKIDRYTLFEADVWQSTEEYAQGDIVKYTNKTTKVTAIWVSVHDTNTNHKPTTSNNTHWELKTLQYEQTITSESRLVIVRKISPTSGPVVYYSDGISTTIADASQVPMAQFSDSTQPYNLTWQYLLETYYTEFINMLNQLKVVGCLFNLTETDIQNLDFTKLKYVEYFGNHFYLNKVEDYLQGKSTLCTIIRM